VVPEGNEGRWQIESRLWNDLTIEAKLGHGMQCRVIQPTEVKFTNHWGKANKCQTQGLSVHIAVAAR